MQKRNVLRLCRLRVLRVLRGKKYRFSLATRINAATDALSSLFLERKRENFLVRGANMQKRNMLCFYHLRVLRVLRGKKYRFSLATRINAATAAQKSVKIRKNPCHPCAPIAFTLKKLAAKRLTAQKTSSLLLVTNKGIDGMLKLSLKPKIVSALKPIRNMIESIKMEVQR